MPQIKAQKYVNNLQSASLRDFSGGWNTLDDDLNLSTKFSTKLFNMTYNADGTVSSRFGTRFFADVRAKASLNTVGIVNAEYYNSALVVITTNGEVFKVTGDGVVTRIFDTAKASVLPGSPSAWHTTEFCSFAQFNGELTIHNGVDKPLIVRKTFAVEYLHDEATGSNINTPIGRYAAVCNSYLVISGDPLHPNRIHISARYTSGTFYGDALPNDGTFIDVGSNLSNASIIRGIASFRDKLIVGYTEGSLIGALGIYDADGNHVPDFSDAIEQYGAVSHRSMISYGDDMLMMDQVGVPSLKKTVFTGSIRPERVSDLVDREIASKLSLLSSETIEDHCFGIYNQREGQFMFFIPNSDNLLNTTETKVYTFTYRPTLNVAAWARFDGWNFTCSCRSIQGNVFFGDNNGKLWVYGSTFDDIGVDFLSDLTVNAGNGVAVNIDWELPWSDLKQRTKSKTMKYITFDTHGSEEFDAMMYVDEFLDAPQLATKFVGGDTGGFGNGTQNFGGGRNTKYKRKWAWPAKFQVMKLRFTGSVTSRLKFVSISIQFQRGSDQR